MANSKPNKYCRDCYKEKNDFWHSYLGKFDPRCIYDDM